MAHHPPTDDQIRVYDDPEPGSTWFVGLAGVVVFSALVLALSVLYYGTDREQVEAVVVRPKVEPLENLRTAQLERISEYQRYTFVDPDGKEESRIRIPVSEAMRKMVAAGRLSLRPPASPSAPPAAPASEEAPPTAPAGGGGEPAAEERSS